MRHWFLVALKNHEDFCSWAIEHTHNGVEHYKLTHFYTNLKFRNASQHTFSKVTEQHFHDIHLPEKDIYRPLHQMGFVHSRQIQNKSYPHAHLSLLPNLLLCFLAAICSCWSLKTSASKWLQGIIIYNLNAVLNRNRNSSKPNSPVSTFPKKDIIILLPYLGLPQNNQISKRLKSCVCHFYSCVKLKIIFQNTRRIKSFFPYKARLNRSQQSQVIYIAGCWDCNDFIRR